MSATLYLAPAAGGKTAQAVARLRAVRAESAFAPLIVILPNGRQLAAFQNRLRAAGGLFGAQLFTFYGLYAELLARAGQPLPVLEPAEQTRVLRGLVEELAAAGGLTHFAPLVDKAGFPAVLREAFEELKRARLLPEAVARAGAPLGPRLRELAALYARYQTWLQTNAWADPEGAGWLAALALEREPALAQDWRLLVVDGFDEFNPTQLEVLRLLAARAPETLVTLTGAPGHPPRLAHRRFMRAQRQVVDALQPIEMPAPEPVPDPLAPDLRRLEAQLFEAAPPAPAAAAAVTFVEAQTRVLEARAALRWIKARLLETGQPAGTAAIVVRTLEPYRALLEEAAREFDVPLDVVGGGPLAACPLISALLAVLDLPAESDWRPRQVSAALRSPYFDWAALGLPPGAGAALDAVARAGQVVAGADQWRAALETFTRARPAAEVEDGDAPAVPMAVALLARAAFEALTARLTPPPAAALRAHLAFIEDLIGDAAPAAQTLNVVACIQAAPETAARDLAALSAFKQVLRGLVRAEALAAGGARGLDYAAGLRAVREAVQAAAFSAPAAGGVCVASVTDVRGLSFAAVAVLGLAEGEFPPAEREMPLLREVDRAALNAQGLPVEPRLRGEEVTLFYHAVTRARDHLLLSRPYLADDGQAWEPSAYWRAARRVCGDPAVIRVRAEDRLPPDQIASPVEWIDHGYAPERLAPGLAVLRARLAEAAAGPHEGDLSALAPAVAARFAPERGWSASRLEAYGTCGYYFYSAYVLGLEPRVEPQAGYDVRALGSLYHAVLEAVYQAAPDPAQLADVLQQLPSVAARVFAAAPEQYGFRPTALWRQQQAELLRALEKTVTALAEASAGWTPRYFEQRFGGEAPPLVVATDAGPVRVGGYIDRVDVDAAGRLRVVDYKTGGAAITPADLAAGRRLQLPLYAWAARDALGLGEVTDGLYWHIGSAQASSLRLADFPGGVAGALETARRWLAAHVAQIRAGQFQPRPPAAGCPAYCPAAAFCWRFAPARG